MIDRMAAGLSGYNVLCGACTFKRTDKNMLQQTFNYNEEAQRVRAALREVFPQDTIATEPGYNGRVHVKIVSERFNGQNEEQKQQIIWEILAGKLGSASQAVSLALAYGADEL